MIGPRGRRASAAAVDGHRAFELRFAYVAFVVDTPEEVSRVRPRRSSVLRKIQLGLLIVLFAVNPALAAGVPCAAWSKLLARPCCCEVEAPARRACCAAETERTPASPHEHQFARAKSGCRCKATPSDDARTVHVMTVRTDSSHDAHTAWLDAGARVSSRTLLPFDASCAPACTSSPPRSFARAAAWAAIDACFLPSATRVGDLLTAIGIARL